VGQRVFGITASGAQAELVVVPESTLAGIPSELNWAEAALRARSTCEKAEATRRFAAHVLPLVVRGLVRPVIDRTYALEEIRAAHQRLESNATLGKIVIKFS
jgi:NADPH:quinone reductase-like Zn-dependent oxidoreductase